MCSSNTVGSCQGVLGIDLLASEAALSVAPSCILLIVSIPRIFYLQGQPIKARKGWKYAVKLMLHFCLAVAHLLLLVLFSGLSVPRTDLTILTQALCVAGASLLCYLTCLEHCRSSRPSTVLEAYLLLTIMLDIPRSVALYALVENQAISALLFVCIALKTAILPLEMAGKQSNLLEKFRDAPPEVYAGIINRSFFFWLNPLLWVGTRKRFDMDDLFSMETSMVPDPAGKLEETRKSLDLAKHGALRLITKLAPTVKWELAAGVLPRLAQSGFGLCQPYLIKYVIRYLSGHSSPVSGPALLVAGTVIYVGIAVATTMSQHKTCRAIVTIRGVLCTVIYSKTLATPSYACNHTTAMTLMSTDMDRIITGLQRIHNLWASLMEMAFCMWLLYRELFLAGITPIVVALVSSGVALLVAMAAAARQADWITAIQDRVGVTAHSINAMKSIKMMGLGERYSTSIQHLRSVEISISTIYRSLLIFIIGLTSANTILTPVISLTIYALIPGSRTMHDLTAERALTTLGLFKLFAEAIADFLLAIAETSVAMSCINRVHALLSTFERCDDPAHPVIESTCNFLLPGPCEKRPPAAICAQNLSTGWRQGSRNIVHDLSFTIEKGSLVMVVGPVGSGKSTLLNVLLGETAWTKGSLHIAHGPMAYCAQLPWLANGTVKENIMGRMPPNPAWYETVLNACGLRHDLLRLQDGDRTHVGHGGSLLSGGQKQRVALARAVYADSTIILLDDPLSSMDQMTGNHIFTHLLGPDGLLRRRNTTVVCVMSTDNHLSSADHVIVLDKNGTIRTQGSFRHVQSETNLFWGLQNAPAIPADSPTEQGPSLSRPCHPGDPLADEQYAGLIQSLSKNRMGDMATFRYYLSTAPAPAWILYFGMLVCCVFCQVFSTVWVTWWFSDKTNTVNRNLPLSIGVYIALGVGAMVSLYLTAQYYLEAIVQRAMSNVHRDLLRTVFSAPMSFFWSNSSGSILNRFSQDIELMDFDLPISFLNTSVALFLCVGNIIVICFSSKLAAAVVAVCMAAYYIVGRFYICSSQQLRVLGLELKAPLFTNYMETTSGLETIRAFGLASMYQSRNSQALANSQRPLYLLFASQRWLSLVLDLIVAGLVTALIAIVISPVGSASPSFTGLALVSKISLSISIKGLIMHWTTLETALGAVSRTKSFLDTTPVEDSGPELTAPYGSWLDKGAVQFEDVSASYSHGGPRALKSVSFSIYHGEKVAVCGTSGSGKSSLLMALLRMVDIIDGRISINQVDIAEIPPLRLRSSVISVPQDPVLQVASTIRDNIDPFRRESEDRIVGILQEVGLWNAVQEKGGLYAIVDAQTLSSGQKQLLCMARAVLQPGGLVLLDECTSSVDQSTANVINRLVHSCFRQQTVIAIIHRLESIMDFNRVLVMEHGVLVQDGGPREIVSKPGALRDLFCAKGNVPVRSCSLE
ncbi:P-loop containing nucleoside triphosphate hydrolase protein [Aspergillus floccosus]